MTSQAPPLSLQINIEIDGRVHRIDYGEQQSVREVAARFVRANGLQEGLVDSLANSISSFLSLFKKGQFEKCLANDSQVTKAESRNAKLSQSQFFKRPTCQSEESPERPPKPPAKGGKGGGGQAKRKKPVEKRSKSTLNGRLGDTRATIPKCRRSADCRATVVRRAVPPAPSQPTERTTVSRRVSSVNQRLYYDQVTAKVEKLRSLEAERRLRQAALEAEERSTFRPQINYTSELLNEVTSQEPPPQLQDRRGPLAALGRRVQKQAGTHFKDPVGSPDSGRRPRRRRSTRGPTASPT